MTRPVLSAALAAAIAMTATAALAQHSGHGSHGASAAPAAAETASTKAYRAASGAMHKDMAIAYTGDADVDFVRGMIPHHQGAVAMARVVLAHGKDPDIRKLAEEIIKAQEGEIAWMRDWLKKKGQ